MKLTSVFSSFVFVFSTFVLCCGLQATASAQEAVTETTQPNVETQPTEPPVAEIQSWPSFEKAFEAGVASYQAQKYDEARLAFTQALEKEPRNVQTLTNLALVQYQLGQKGWAVALLRKAHGLDPDFSTPHAALDFILPQLDVKEIPHEIQFRETIRTQLIAPFTLQGFLALFALSFFATGWLWLHYIGKRREALRSEEPLPPFPVIPTVIAVIFICVLSLTVLKMVDQVRPRGTIVLEKITVYSAPNDKSVALFDLFAGLEVLLKQQDENWVQVTYPGAMTGWIPKSSVFQTSGRTAW